MVVLLLGKFITPLGRIRSKHMCLGVPGQVLSIDENDPLTRMGKVQFGGIRKDISLAFVPEADVGDYVIVHAGFAISQLDEDRATEVLDTLEQLEQPL